MYYRIKVLSIFLLPRSYDSSFPKGHRAIFDPETQTRKQRTTEVNKLSSATQSRNCYVQGTPKSKCNFHVFWLIQHIDLYSRCKYLIKFLRNWWMKIRSKLKIFIFWKKIDKNHTYYKWLKFRVGFEFSFEVYKITKMYSVEKCDKIKTVIYRLIKDIRTNKILGNFRTPCMQHPRRVSHLTSERSMCASWSNAPTDELLTEGGSNGSTEQRSRSQRGGEASRRSRRAL